MASLAAKSTILAPSRRRTTALAPFPQVRSSTDFMAKRSAGAATTRVRRARPSTRSVGPLPHSCSRTSVLGWVAPAPTLSKLIQDDRLVTATGSTTAVRDARASGIAAFDGDLATSWAADPDDVRPTLSVNFAVARSLRRVTLVVPDAAPVRRPPRVRLTWPGGTRDVDLDASGQARFPQISTDRIQLTILDTDAAVSIARPGGGAADRKSVVERKRGEE